jgi:hypothetical protein
MRPAWGRPDAGRRAQGRPERQPMSVGESDRAKGPRTQGKSAAGDPGEGKARQGGATSEGHMGGAQKPKAMSPELRRIAEKAREDHRVPFTSLAPRLLDAREKVTTYA